MKSDIRGFSEEVSHILPTIIRGVMRQQGSIWGLANVTMPQFLSLELIDSHEKLKMKEIAEQLNVSLPAASGLIKRLFALGYVKRLYGTRDRRIIYIVLTAKGKKTVAHVRDQRKKAFQQTFGKLTDVERRQYLAILKKVQATLYRE